MKIRSKILLSTVNLLPIGITISLYYSECIDNFKIRVPTEQYEEITTIYQN